MNDWRAQAGQASGITLDAMFRRAFSLHAGRTAVSWSEGRRSYAELGERAWRLANALHDLGYRRGDTIAVLSETRPEYIECYAALAALGITVATLNVRLHPGELAACLRKCRPVGMLVSDTLAPIATKLHADAPEIRHWISFGSTEGFDDYESLLRASRPAEPPRIAQGGDTHNILVTSGTYATFRRADVTQMFALIERDRLTWTLLLPGVITDFLDHPARAAHDLSTLRFAIGYANMMPQVVTRLTEACGIDFYDASVGMPGECVVRGPTVMSGYLDDDAANAEVFGRASSQHHGQAAAARTRALCA